MLNTFHHAWNACATNGCKQAGSATAKLRYVCSDGRAVRPDLSGQIPCQGKVVYDDSDERILWQGGLHVQPKQTMSGRHY